MTSLHNTSIRDNFLDPYLGPAFVLRKRPESVTMWLNWIPQLDFSQRDDSN